MRGTAGFAGSSPGGLRGVKPCFRFSDRMAYPGEALFPVFPTARSRWILQCPLELWRIAPGIHRPHQQVEVICHQDKTDRNTCRPGDDSPQAVDQPLIVTCVAENTLLAVGARHHMVGGAKNSMRSELAMKETYQIPDST